MEHHSFDGRKFCGLTNIFLYLETIDLETTDKHLWLKYEQNEWHVTWHDPLGTYVEPRVCMPMTEWMHYFAYMYEAFTTWED